MSWQIDPAHTAIHFTARHMMIATVRGEFRDFEGSVEFDQNDPVATRVNVTIQTTSIDTREPKRDAHLRSPDFFDAEQYPTMTFKSTRVEVSDDRHATLYGNLTIKGVTKEAALDVTYLGSATSPWGTNSVGFAANGKISRSDWGLTWNQALETGGVLVSDEIGIMLDVELVRQVEQVNEPAAD